MFGKARRQNLERIARIRARMLRRGQRRWWTYKRRWIIWGGMAVLLGVIGLYNYATDDDRIRTLLERQMNERLGGKVVVEQASFSIFRGLAVKGVTIYVEPQAKPSALLLKANELRVTADYLPMFRLQLPAIKQVIAEGVHVNLQEDVRTGRWNFANLIPKQEERPAEPEQQGPAAPRGNIPDVYLNNASITYWQRDGEKIRQEGRIEVDAGLHPMSEGQCSFTIQTHPPQRRTATTVVGFFDRDSGAVSGRISELQFDEAVRSLLPHQVQAWMAQFGFAGRFSVPRFVYRFATPGVDQDFEVTLAFADVQALVRPRDWLTRRERDRMEMVQATAGLFRRLGLNEILPKNIAIEAASEDGSPTDAVGYVAMRARSIPLELRNLNGRVTLTPKQISIQQVGCSLQGQQLSIKGTLDGYGLGSPANLEIRTAEGTYLQIPPSRQFMTWLPEDVRKIYLQFQPTGKTKLLVQLRRTLPDGDLDPVVVANISEAQFIFDDFPYPLQNCDGQFLFMHDRQKKQDLLYIQHLRGHGLAGGVNVNSTIEINGIVGPFVKGGPGVHIQVDGWDIGSEPSLRKAFPPEVAKAMIIFAPPDYGKRLAESPDNRVVLSDEEIFTWPKFFGDFRAKIDRADGPFHGVDTDVHLWLKKASGTLKAFPYPMENLSCELRILDGAMTISDLKMPRNGATLRLNGDVTFGDPTNIDLHAEVHDVAIDDDLCYSLPRTERSWVQKAGLGGRLDIAGRIFTPPGSGDVDFGLDLTIRDGTLLKDVNGPAFSAVSGKLFLKPARLDFNEVAARRGEADVAIRGSLDWLSGIAVDLNLGATKLLLDQALHDILPEVARENWDQQKPQGTVDLDVHYTSAMPPESSATTRPVEHVEMTLSPRKLTVKPDVFPYHMTEMRGQVYVKDDYVELREVRGRHGPAEVAFSGKGTVGQKLDFTLKVNASKVPADAKLLAAIPSSVADMVRQVKTTGNFDIRFDQLDIKASSTPRRVRPAAAAPKAKPATAPTTAPSVRPLDVLFNCVITTADGQLNIGVPISDIHGWGQVSGEIRADDLVRMDGTVNLASYGLLGREGSNLEATIRRLPFTQEFEVPELRTTLAGGSLSGALTLKTPDEGPSQYAVELAIRNADVNALAAGAVSKPIRARLSGSLTVDGIFDDEKSRRGRGELLINGAEMVEVPLMLGLYQMVQLGLPVSEGVNQVQVSYVLSAGRVTLEQLTLQSPGLLIEGKGWLDFDSRKIDLNLKTKNRAALKLPIVGPLFSRGLEELLRIHVGGTLEEPRVNAEAMPTFRATLNQVIGDVAPSEK